MARRKESRDQSLDIRTAFDEAKPKHVARILDDHNTHG